MRQSGLQEVIIADSKRSIKLRPSCRLVAVDKHEE